MKLLATCLFITPFLTSFVLLGKKPASLACNPDQASVTFHWSTSAATPTLSGKEKYKDGSFANYSDAELVPILLQEAMDQWNTVRGSYLRFELQSDTEQLSLNKSDNVNNIVVQKVPSASTAAYASPEVADGSTTISDCDIVINNTKVSALSFLETVTHELGHCVGLGHPHTNYGAIMSYSRGGSSYRLSSDDKAGAIFLYPDPNYVSSEPKELVGCGSIRGQHSDETAGPWLYMALVLPILISLSYRQSKKATENGVG
jgi:Matrixin